MLIKCLLMLIIFMAVILLKPNADPLQVAEDLRKSGITMTRSLGNNRFVAYKRPKIDLSELFEELKRRKGEDYRWRWFKILYDGWRAKGIRNGIHSAPFYTAAWRRGWLYTKDANSFCDYMITGWMP